eukprot:jgi/Chlat1/4304/Chrsp29S04472
MPQRHSKNNNDRGQFTYEERRKLRYGTQAERLGKDSIKAFDACCLCLHTASDPLACQSGHLFCKECIYECLLQQKKDIKRQQEAYSQQLLADEAEAAARANAHREKELELFERSNNSAAPLDYSHTIRENISNEAEQRTTHGASSVKTTQFEEEALRGMKAFWLPSMTPEANGRAEPPSSDTICPEGRERLRLKQLFPIHFTEVPEHARSQQGRQDDIFMCPSCKDTLTNTTKLVTVSLCGHVLCSECAKRFIIPDKVCFVCSKKCKEKDLVELQKGGTGFAAHGEDLTAKTFKHVGGSSIANVDKPGKAIPK